MNAFKTLCAGLMVAGASFAVVGCEASMKTTDSGESGMKSGSSYEKKTVTETAPNGDKTTHTEMQKTN